MKKIIRDYFTFSKKERTGAVILLLLIGVFVAVPYFFKAGSGRLLTDITQEDSATTQRQIIVNNENENSNGIHSRATVSPINPERKAILFEFDPNVISAKQWMQLGLREKTARTILNYRSKGGKFKTAEDIRKIWGLRREEADRIIPYARVSFKKTGAVYAIVDINTATAEQWKALPGIGEVLSNRIVRFREKIGGFTSVQQVGKTYGLKDTVFQRLLPYLKIDSAH